MDFSWIYIACCHQGSAKGAPEEAVPRLFCLLESFPNQCIARDLVAEKWLFSYFILEVSRVEFFYGLVPDSGQRRAFSKHRNASDTDSPYGWGGNRGQVLE